MKQSRSSTVLLTLLSAATGIAAPPHRTGSNATDDDILSARNPTVFDIMTSVHEAGQQALVYMTLDLTNPDVQAVQRSAPRQQIIEAKGWQHTDWTETTISDDIAALEGFDGVEGLTFNAREGIKWREDRKVETSDPSEWRSSSWDRAQTVKAGDFLKTRLNAAGWAFHWTMSPRYNVIIVTHAVSASFWTQEGPGPEEPIYEMTQKDWSDYTYKDFGTLKKHKGRYVPPKAIFIPALRGPSEDIEIIKLCLQDRGLGPREKAITFPIGSLYHELILGTKFGIQVAQFLYQHKAKLDDSIVVAIHVWDAGHGTTMSVLFSIQLYDEQVKRVERTNRDAHGLWEAVCATEWPSNLNPRWAPVDGAGTGVTAGNSLGQT